MHGNLADISFLKSLIQSLGKPCPTLSSLLQLLTHIQKQRVIRLKIFPGETPTEISVVVNIVNPCKCNCITLRVLNAFGKKRGCVYIIISLVT